MSEINQLEAPSEIIPEKNCIHPSSGEVITSLATNNSYTFENKIGEGSFGVVYSCTDIWGNQLAHMKI